MSQASGSRLFIFAVCSSVAMVAQVRPPPSLPAKSEFFRLCKGLHKRNYAKLLIMRRLSGSSANNLCFTAISKAA